MWRASQPPARGWTNAELVFTLRALWILVLSVRPPVPSHPPAKPGLLSPSSLSPRSLGLDKPPFLESALPWPLSSLSSLHLPLCNCFLANLPASSFSHTQSPLLFALLGLQELPSKLQQLPLQDKGGNSVGPQTLLLSHPTSHLYFRHFLLHRLSATLRQGLSWVEGRQEGHLALTPFSQRTSKLNF